MELRRLSCPTCGAPCRALARFCGQCGRPLPGFVTAPTDPVGATPVPTSAPGPPAEALAAPRPLAPDDLLAGRYRVEREIGRGGFGNTFLARDLVLDRPCVLKRLRIQPTWSVEEHRRRVIAFDHEARLLAQLNDPGHTHIPAIYDYLADQHCLVMKYVAGRSLADLVQLYGRLPIADVLRYTRATCAALVYMHGRAPEPVLHRDVKPSNILLDTAGQIWLIDFGLAHVLLRGGARPLESAGTYGFAPPEQWQGHAEPRSDVYALVATFYALLSGNALSISDVLTSDNPGALIVELIHAQEPELPGHFTALLARSLDPDPRLRPSAAELLEALDALIALRDLPAPAPAAPLPNPVQLKGREDDHAAITAALEAQHLAVLVGPAGIGKTALAATVARSWPHPNRVYWLAFHAGDSAGDLLWSLASFLARLGVSGPWRMLHSARGGEPVPTAVALNYIVQMLQAEDCLLILDDLHLVEAAEGYPPMIERLVGAARAGDLRLLITTRQWPAALAEQSPQPSLAGITAAAALELLTPLIPELAAGVAARLHALTEGNPQLLLLAAEALREAGEPARLLDHLMEAASIERYLIRAVDQQLSPVERQVMTALAVLMGHPAQRAALEALLDGLALRTILSGLAHRQLLVVSGTGAERTYRLHTMLQPFYYEQLDAAARQALHRRAGAYYAAQAGQWLLAARHHLLAGERPRSAALIAEHSDRIIGQGQALSLLELIDALADAELAPPVRVGLRLAEGDAATPTREFSRAQGAYTAAYHALEALPDPTQRQSGIVRVCLGLGELLDHKAPEEALVWLRRGLDHVGQSDAVAAGRLYAGLGATLQAVADREGAQAALTQALACLPEGERVWRARALIALSAVAGSQGDLIGARRAAGAALELHQQAGNLLGMIGALQNLALARDEDGDWAGAANEYQQALSIAQQVGSVVHQTELLLNLGVLRLQQGRYAEAAQLLDQSHALARRHHLGVQTVYIQSSRADLFLRTRRWGAAGGALVEAWRLARRLDVGGQLAEIYRGLGLLRLGTGHPRRALRHAARAIDTARREDDPLGEGGGLRVRGQALLAEGRREEALRDFAQSAALLGGGYERARTLLAWGRALPPDQPAAAALLAEAHQIFERLGVQRDG